MTVKELIKELQIWDPDTEVCIEDNQWAQPIKKVSRDLYYSDGKHFCVDEDKAEGLIAKRIVIVLKHQ